MILVLIPIQPMQTILLASTHVKSTGNSSNTEPTTSSKLGFGQWFEQDFFRSRLAELATDVVTIGLSALGPAATIFLSDADSAFYSIHTILGTIDYSSFLNDVSNRNHAETAVALGNIVFDVINTLWSHLSEPEMIAFAFAEGACDIGTLGIGDVIDLDGVITASIAAGASYAAEIGGDYAQYYCGK
jgi:hypothetical protein